jgi:hypothetical protein
VLQVTSGRLPGAGLVEAGAGLVNVVAAVDLVRAANVFPATKIGGEPVTASGITYGSDIPAQLRFGLHADILVWGSLREAVPQSTTDIFVWGNILVWGNGLVWGDIVLESEILVWGNTDISDILVWGSSAVWRENIPSHDILVWGNSHSEQLDFTAD